MSCINARALDSSGRAQQPAAQPVEVVGEGVHHREGGVDLQPAGD
jgi:hypothetical protein